jgi:sigma-B regulation protein RsbU (phosphoserine phosphatase)
LQPDPDAGSIELRLCLGGHPPALLVAADGAVTAVGHPGTLLGMFPDVRLREERLELHPGEILLLYTDGLSDESGSLAAMTEPDLRRFLADNRALTAEQVAQQLEAEVGSHPRSALRDDVAFLVLRVRDR